MNNQSPSRVRNAQADSAVRKIQSMPLKSLVAALSTVLGLGLSTHGIAANLATDGKTATSVAQGAGANANIYDVNTTTLSSSGKVGFNSFSAFTVDKGDTVNLHLASGTTSLVNLVWNSQAVINGKLNSVLDATSKTGGSVYFADPYGVVVGSDAVLNMGALSLSAPTVEFMSSLLGTDGKVDPGSTAFTTLMQGQEPLAKSSGTCLICVAGTVNAANAVRIRATAIDVSGTIYVAGTGTDTLSTAVNVEGQSAPQIVTDGNTIRLVAEDSDSAEFGDASADATIHVGGKLTTANAAAPASGDPAASSWGLIQVTAKATAKSAFETPDGGSSTATLLTGQAGDLLKDQDSFAQKGIEDAAVDANLAASDKLGQFAYVRASATASVDISGTLAAAGDVAVGAATETEASTEATAEAGADAAPVMIGAMYGAVYSKADTTLETGAKISAGGAVALAATTDNTLDVSADTVAGDQPLASTMSWSQAAVSASSVVNGAITGQSLGVLAHNANSFSTEASTKTSATSGSVGIAGAVSLQTVNANAQLNSSPIITSGGSGDVTVAAGTDTAKNNTSASTDTGAESTKNTDDETGKTNADMSATLVNTSNAGLNKGGDKSSDALPFHLGGAVAYTDSSNSSSATIGNGVQITTPGDVAVYSNVSDAGVHNGAKAAAISKAEGDAKDGSGNPESADVAAAVAYANYAHNSSATIGTNAVISADHIGVGSDVTMPFDWFFGQADNVDAVKNMFGSLDDFVAGAQALKSLSKFSADDITDGVTGYASASAGGNAKVAVGGSVNYLAVKNSNQAWVGDGSKLTSTANAAADDSWQTDIDWLDNPVQWDHSLSVAANTDVTVFDLVGDIKPWKGDTDGDKAAIGGAFNYSGYDNDTVAGVGSGATLKSNKVVAVNATSSDTVVALSPVSGKGGTASLQGTVAITDVNDATHASISGDANVTAQAVDVAASNPLMVWSLSGALAMSSGASIGVSVGINSMTTDTVAMIGDNSADDPAVAAGARPGQTGGTIAAATLDINARTNGESGALSVAGTSVSSDDGSGGGSGGGGSSGGGGGSGDSGGEAPGQGLLDLLEKVKSVTGKLQTGVATVDGLAGATDGGTGDEDSLLGKAGGVLEQVSNATEGASSAGGSLQKLLGKASSEGESKGGSKTTSSGASQKSSFGIGVSGAASVNLAKLGAKATLDGVTVDNVGGTDVSILGMNQASLTSVAGAAALQRSKNASFGGALAGAVSYSSVADSTSATINNSTLSNAGKVSVDALDGSQQIGVAVGMGVNTSNGTSTTIAGSVSLATSSNSTTAAIEGNSTLDAGSAADSSLDVTAYDHSRIGVGGGSLYVNTSSGSSGNVGIGVTYANIANTTTATLSGHTGASGATDIGNYDALTLRALDSSLIGAGALAGGYSGSQNSASLAGAIVWTQIGNTTTANVDNGMTLSLDGPVSIQASAVAPVDALDAVIGSRDAEGYDFAGANLGTPDGLSAGSTPGSSSDPSQPGADVLAIPAGLGSSIIAIAGTVQSGGNNVGLSYVGNNVSNTHSVIIDNATIQTSGALSMNAADDTRMIGLAVGAAMSSGQFAGLGSATSNIINNTDSILVGSAATAGHSASLSAASIDAEASDNSSIYALAGNVAISKGQAAAGGAVTYNDIGNQVVAHAGNTAFDVGGALNVDSNESAMIMAGAVAAAVAGNGTALTLSFGWNQTGNASTATIDGGSTLSAGSVAVNAGNGADIYALTGGVSIGGDAAVGLAASVADIGDTTTATLQDVGLNVAAANGADGSVKVGATGSGTQYSLSVAGAVGTDGAGVAGSATYNTISSNVTATASDLYGLTGGALDSAQGAVAQSLAIGAQNSAGIYSLAGGLGFGSDVGVGAAATIADVGGRTSANLSDSILDISQTTTVTASSGTTIDTASIAGSAASSVAVSASDTTNLIHNSINAGMTNVGTVNPSGSAVTSGNLTTIQAIDGATINALAGAVGGAGSVAVGAAVAVNRIGTTTNASFLGGAANRTYEAKQLLVNAGAINPVDGSGGNAANINTIAVGAAGGGDVAAAGSVAVNVMTGSTDARIDHGAFVIASDNIGVLAGNDQGIDVFAGQAALSGSVGVGVGVMVNDIAGSTTAGIYGSNVTAYGANSGLDVDSGVAKHAASLDDSVDIAGSDSNASAIGSPTNFASPDLSGITTTVHGVAVNATNLQHIATLGLGASVGGDVAVNALAGVNVVGGSTNAVIDHSSINQADRVQDQDGIFYDFANTAQQADVRATSRQYEANFVANIAGSGTAAVNGSAASNVFDAQTTARITDSTTSSQAGSAIDATGQQWSLAVAAGAAASGEVGAAASGAVTIFNAQTSATLDGGSLSAGSLDVDATSSTVGAQVVGAVGIGVGTAGIAGAAGVNVDETKTTATIENGADVHSSGAVNVDANSRNVDEAVVVGGAVGLYAGIAGGALVNVIGNTTQASIENSTVQGGNIGVNAQDAQTVSAFTGVLGGGFVGVGGGINLTLLQSSVKAGVIDSALTALGNGSSTGNIAIAATSTRDLDSSAVAIGVGAVGVGLSADVIVVGTGNISDDGDATGDLHSSGQVNLDNLDSLAGGNRLGSDPGSYGLSSDQLSASDVSAINSSSSYSVTGATGSSSAAFGASDGVQAKATGGSLSADGSVSLNAGVTSTTKNVAGAGGVGIVGVGGALAYTSLNSDIEAAADGGATINAGHGVSIHAAASDGSGKAVTTSAYAGVGGLVGIGAAVAVSHVENQITARAAGSLTSSTGQGTLAVNASDSSSVQAGNDNLKGANGVSLGGIVAGAVIVDALRSSDVTAALANDTQASGFSAVNIAATDAGSVTANGVMGAGGILDAISAVVANASDASQVSASIGTKANIDAANTSVVATAAPTASAGARGITVGGIGGGIGANVAIASVSAVVNAFVDDNSSFGSGNLAVNAIASPTVNATSTGGAGAAMFGANASDAEASDTTHVTARVGKNVKLPSGNVAVSASNTTHQSANASGVSAGLVAVGASHAKASSNTTTIALLDDGNGSTAATAGSLSVVAIGSDINDANAKAGSGGLVSGNAALAETSATANTRATIGQNLVLTNLSSFQLNATQTDAYGGAADSVLAAAVGGSGANVDNTIASTTDAKVSDGTTIATLGNIDVLAQTTVGNDSANNGGATGGAGGIVTGNAAGVDTQVTTNNTAEIGANVKLSAGLDTSATTLGHTAVLAGTVATALGDTATITTGGAVPIANAKVKMSVNATNAARLGNGDTIFDNGRTDIGTYSALQQVAGVATANTFGAAPVGLSDATVNLSSTQTVGIGDNVSITGYGEIDIVAGKDILNARETLLSPSAVAQSYVRGLIAIPHAAATANTISNATLTMGSGTTVTGGGDVAVGAVQGASNIAVDGTGHGYELGFIPATQHSNSQSASGLASTTIDGSITAGAFDTINLNIDANGVLTDTGTTAPYTVVLDKSFNPTTYLNSLDQTSGGVYSGMDNAAVGGLLFNPLFASGGNLYLYGASVSGSGHLTANGAPSITINNYSPYYMVLPEITTSFGSSGQILVSGGADPNNLGGIGMTQTPSTLAPTITINSLYAKPNAATPGIILGDVTNLGGAFNLKDLTGSLLQRGEVRANSQNVDVPNGYVTVEPNPSGIWFSGADPTSNLGSSWISQFLNGIISNPDNAAGAIADSQYGEGAVLLGGTSGVEQQVLVLYGSCAPHTGGSGSEESLDGCGGSGPSGAQVSVLGRNVPEAPYIALSQNGKFSGSELSSTSVFTGGKFIVNAKYIDIDGAINAGTPATWTVQTTDALKAWITAQNTAYQNGQISNPLIPLTVIDNAGNSVGLKDANGNVLLQLVGGTSSQLIGAVYNVATGQIILNNVNASGGGSVDLHGKIVSTAAGSINVNSGYGSVTVNNTTGVPLVVQNVFAGSGGLGLITIKDDLQTWADGPMKGQAKITWYVSNNGQPAQEYDNYNGAADWTSGRLLGAVTSATTYAPAAGSEYSWTASTNVTRAWLNGSGNHSWGLGNWNWADASGQGSAGQHWTLGSSGFIDPGAYNHVDLGGNDYNVSINGNFTYPTYEVDVAYHGCDSHGNCHYGSHQSGTDGSGNPASIWAYLYPTNGQLTVTDVQRADLPIGISFVTSASNSVDISSNNNILLTGQITNTNGPTSLSTSDGGNILQSADNALIWTHSLSLSALGGGSIGTDAAPVKTRIAHDASPGSTLVASTDGGDINVDVDSGNSAQAFNAIAQGVDVNGNAVYGNVSIHGTGSLVGIAGKSRDVIGRDVSLVSTIGSIGSLVTPLNIETHPDELYNGGINGGTLDAQANGDIGLVDWGGDTWIGSVVSTTGDVYLKSPNGGLYDARQLDPGSTLSSDQASAIWNKLHLTDGTAADATITAVQNSVNASYAQYWQLLNVGSVVNGVYALNANAMALYWPLAAAANGIDPASITDPAQQASMTQAYAASHYNAITQDFTTYIGADWTNTAEFNRASADSGYSFVLDTGSAIYKQITQNATWTDSELKYAINVAALATPTGTQVGATTPNVAGHNITLIAGDGGVGRTDSPLTINYTDLQNLYGGQSNALSTKQILALGLANAPGDVVLLDANGNVLSPNDPDLGSKLVTLSIRQTMPLYVTATGEVQGSATGSAYLQANGDLNLAGFSSGTDMRLASTGSIQAAPGSAANTAVLTTGGDLVLTAGGGHISLGDGSSGQPGDALPVQIGGKLLSASAVTDLLLRQLAGNLTVGTVFANNLLSLEATGGSILASLDSLSLNGGSIDLVAAGDIGRRAVVTSGVDAPLELQVGDAGYLNATAGGMIDIDSPQFALHVDTVHGGGNVTLTSVQAGLDAKSIISDNGTVTATSALDGSYGTVDAGQGISLNAAGALEAGTLASTSGDIALNAVSGMELDAISALAGNLSAQLIGGGNPQFLIDAGGNIDVSGTIALGSGGTLAMGQGSAIQGGDTVTLNSSGDMTLGKVGSNAASGDALLLTSGGALVGNGDAVNLVARQGGLTTLSAVNDIGTSAQAPLVVDVNTLTGSSSTGNVWLHALGNIDVPDFQAPQGDLSLVVDGALSYANLLSGGAATLSGDSIDGGTLNADGNATITATNEATLDEVIALGDLAIDTGTSLDVNTLSSGGTATLNAGTNMTLGNATTGSDLTATAGGDLAATTLTVGNDASLVSGGDTTFGTATIEHDLSVNAGGDLSGGTLDVGLDADIYSAGNTDLATLSVGGLLKLHAGGDAHVALGTVAGTSTLATGGALALDSFTGGDDVTAQAGTDVVIGTMLLTGGSLTANAGNNLDVTKQLDVQQGNATLDAKQAMTLADVHTAGNLDANAGTALNATTLNAGGESTLNAGTDMTLGSATTGSDLTATAGGDLSAITLTVGNDASLFSGGNTDLAALSVGGLLKLHAGGDAHVALGTVAGTSTLTTGGAMALDSFTGGDDVTAQAGTDVVIGTMTLTAGSLNADAGNNLDVSNQLDVQQGSATLDAKQAMTLADVHTAGNFDAHAGTTLHATTLKAGGESTLNAGTDMTLGSATTGSDLTAAAGGDLSAITLTVGNDASLVSGGNTDLATLSVGGLLKLHAGGDAHVALGTVAGTSTLTTGGALSLDSFIGGDDVTAQAGTDVVIGTMTLTAGSLNADTGNNLDVSKQLDVQQGNATLDAKQAMTLADVHTAGNFDAHAGTTLHATTLKAGGESTLNAGTDMTLGSATTGSDLTATAGNDLDTTTLTIGGNGKLGAGGAMALNGDTSTGGNLDMQSAQHMGFASIESGGHVFGQSLHAGIDGDTVSAADWIRFIAAGDIHIRSLNAGTDIGLQAGGNVATNTMNAGHDIDVTAGGNVDAYNSTAGNAINVDAGGALTVNDATAGHTINLAGQRISFASLSAPDSITLLARNGDITGVSLTTRDAYVAANGDIALDAAFIGDRINLQANDIDANITQTTTGQPLYSVLTGYQDGVAKRITVYADAPDQWMIDRLAALNAALATTAPRADIAKGDIEQTMSLKTSVANLWMNQHSALLRPVDVQLMQPTYDFQLYQDGIHTLTDSFVVRYSYGFQIQTPNYDITHNWLNPDYLGESALRFDGRILDAHTNDDYTKDPGELHAIPGWVRSDDSQLVLPSSDQAAVNIRAPE